VLSFAAGWREAKLICPSSALGKSYGLRDLGNLEYFKRAMDRRVDRFARIQCCCPDTRYFSRGPSSAEPAKCLAIWSDKGDKSSVYNDRENRRRAVLVRWSNVVECRARNVRFSSSMIGH
jgi:hypothetical protein